MNSSTSLLPRTLTVAAALTATALLAASCSSGDTPNTPAPAANAQALEAPASRVVVTYDGGLLVLDGESLETVDTIELEGFNRINEAGDNRHIVISTADAFQVLDTGVWTEDDGTHRAQDPELTDIAFETNKPGHVVPHHGRTVLFSDGTGRVEAFDSEALATGQPETEVYMTAQPHHGVAVELADGGLLVTLGDETTRTGMMVLDKDRNEITRNEDCPGVHGEATAKDEAVVVGCQDGLLVYKDGQITKIDSPDEYGRIGNQAGSEESAVVLGDYKTDKDAELERPERVVLANTETNELRLVELGTSYTFRSLARGPHGEALVLGTDGAIHVIDPDSGEITARIPVIGEWSEPLEWQEPRPALFVLDHTAYVTDPATNSIHAVDIEGEEVTATSTLAQTPNEVKAVSGA